jgi:lipopolysaccharide export system permease protein
MVYNNLLSVINTWVGQGKVAPVFGLLGLHVVMIAVMVLMFYYRVSVFSFNRLLR